MGTFKRIAHIHSYNTELRRIVGHSETSPTQIIPSPLQYTLPLYVSMGMNERMTHIHSYSMEVNGRAF